jgi:hypothetical protein
MLNILYLMENKKIQSILPTVFAIMVLTIIGCSIQNTVVAQSNSNDSSGNQTRAEITDEPETTIINKTTIPAQQTTVTVNETTSSLDKSALQPLQNQTMAEAPVDLSAFKNKTVLQPTGEAQTTMLNKTTVPFEQTTVEGINQTQTQQQGQGNQTGTQQQGQGNQTGTQQQGTSDVASNASQSANQTGEAIQGNASEVGAKASEGAQKLGQNITEGAKGFAETIGKGLQDLGK